MPDKKVKYAQEYLKDLYLLNSSLSYETYVKKFEDSLEVHLLQYVEPSLTVLPLTSKTNTITQSVSNLVFVETFLEPHKIEKTSRHYLKETPYTHCIIPNSHYIKEINGCINLINLFNKDANENIIDWVQNNKEAMDNATKIGLQSSSYALFFNPISQHAVEYNHTLTYSDSGNVNSKIDVNCYWFGINNDLDFFIYYLVFLCLKILLEFKDALAMI